MHPIYTRGFETGCLVLSILSFTLLAIVMRRKTGVDAYPNRFLTLMRYTKRRDRPDSIFSLITAQQFAHGTQGDPVQSLGLHGDELSEERVDTIFRGRRFALKRPSGCGPNESLELLVVPNEDSDLDTSHWYDWITSCLPKFPWWPHFRDTHLWTGSHPVLFQSLPLGIVSFSLVGLFVVAAGQPWWAQDTAFFTFVGDNRFARSTVSTVINTLIWGQIERNAKMMQPIYQLLEDGGMRFNDLELDYMELGIFLDLWFAFRSRLNGPGTKRRSSEKAFICIMIGSYAAELFTVFWNVIALSSYYISLPIWSCLVATEGCMLLSLVILWLQRRRPVVPRQPVTLASNLLYVYASDICEEHFLPSWQSPNSGISNQNDGVDHAMLSPPRSATSDLQQMRDNTITSAYPSGLLKPASRMASRRPSEALSENTRPSSGAVTLVGSSTTLDPATSDIPDSRNPGSSDIEMIHPAPVGPEVPRLGKIKSLDPGMESISSDAGGDSITHSSEAAKIEIAGNPQPRKPATRRWSLVWPTMGRSRRQDCKSKISAHETVSRAQEQARCRFGEFKVGDTWHVGIALYDSVVRPYQLRDRADLEQ